MFYIRITAYTNTEKEMNVTQSANSLGDAVDQEIHYHITRKTNKLVSVVIMPKN